MTIHAPPDAVEAALGLRAVLGLPDGGAVLMHGFPGLRLTVAGEAWIDPEEMAAAIAGLARRRSALLVSLVSRGEVSPHADRSLGIACADVGLRLVRLPVADYAAPGRRWQAAAARFAPQIDRITASGDAVALCCHYGAGRSGAAAAFQLIRHGFAPRAAIAAVRAAFPEAIESPVQERWLDALRLDG